MQRFLIGRLKNADRYFYATVLIVLDTLLAEVLVHFFVANTLGKIRRAYAVQTRETEIHAGKNATTVLPSFEPLALGFYFATVGAQGTRVLVQWVLLDGLWTSYVPRVRAGLIGSCLTALALVVSGIAFWSSLASSRMTFPALALAAELSFPFHAVASVAAFCVLRTYQPANGQAGRSGQLSPAQAVILAVPLALTVVHGWYWIVERLVNFRFRLSGKKKFMPRESRCECSNDE